MEFLGNESNQSRRLEMKIDKISNDIIGLKNMLAMYVKEEFNAKEAANYLNLKVSSLYQLVNQGKIDYHKQGKFLMFCKSNLDHYKKRQSDLDY